MASTVIAFARPHRVALAIEFAAVALLVLAMPGGESWGWIALFGALPWSIAAIRLPGIAALWIVAVGLAFNVVVATIAIGCSVSWWLKTLRYNHEK